MGTVGPGGTDGGSWGAEIGVVVLTSRFVLKTPQLGWGWARAEDYIFTFFSF